MATEAKPAPRKRSSTKKAANPATKAYYGGPQPTYNSKTNYPERGDMLVGGGSGGLPRAGTFDELGVTGLRQYGGFVVEEWLRQLSGPRAAWAWREMADNDSTVGAIMFEIGRASCRERV